MFVKRRRLNALSKESHPRTDYVDGHPIIASYKEIPKATLASQEIIQEEHSNIVLSFKSIALTEDTTAIRPPLRQFIQKLWKIMHSNTVITENGVGVIRWSDDGSAIQIEDTQLFSTFVLPRFFKHNKYSSFVRQMNHYGFTKRKKPKKNSRASKCRVKIDIWQHAHFARDNPESLYLIKAKTKCNYSNTIMRLRKKIKDLEEVIAHQQEELGAARLQYLGHLNKFCF